MMRKAIALCAVLLSPPSLAEETEQALPLPRRDVALGEGVQTTVLAGGCFWGMQGVFQHVKGVREVTAGYSGGGASTARYSAVERGDTGHAEAVRIIYDPKEISFGRLLQVYFSVMDPTTRDRQGPDQGPQYRSEIFAANADQQRVAEAYVAQLAPSFSRPIVTRISLQRSFYPAEEWHQDYLLKNPRAPYIVYNDLPKIEKLKALYPALYRSQPITLARR